MLNKRLRITVGIPTSTSFFHQKFVQSLMSLQYPPNTDALHSIVTGYQLPFARNRIVEEALKNNSDYIFYIDVDMIFPPDALIRLVNRHVDICHALSFRRTPPHYPCLFDWHDDSKCYETVDYSKGDNNLVSVDAAGSACTLINMDVYKKMKKPYYYYHNDAFSSDLTFSMNAKKLGYDIFIDRTLKIGHIGAEIIVTEDHYLATLSSKSKEEWNKNMKKALKEKENY